MFIESPPIWRQIQRSNITRLDDLCDFLELPGELRERLQNFPKFPLNLPRRLASKIQKGTLDDPLARQFLPLQEELIITPNFLKDPVEDGEFQLTPRLLQKYQGRALLLASGACAMHCRYCFRQNYDYEPSTDDKAAGFEKELSLIANDTSLHEVILSGGDPLSLSNQRLIPLLQAISNIPHIERLRFHTRFPIGIPERLDEALLQVCQNLRPSLWVVLHINHPNELDSDVLKALDSWRRSGAILLCQSVLLRDVNDNIQTLLTLFKLLTRHGISPYYLHQLDRVQAAAHFEVDPENGKVLMEQLQALLPGYSIPRFVKEIPGKPSKTTLA